MIDEPIELHDFGWHFHEKCRCSGRLKYSYRHAELKKLELEWYPRNKAFKVTYLGVSTKVPATKISELERTLKNLNDEYTEGRSQTKTSGSRSGRPH